MSIKEALRLLKLETQVNLSYHCNQPGIQEEHCDHEAPLFGQYLLPLAGCMSQREKFILPSVLV
jgi:hypothetical protein